MAKLTEIIALKSDIVYVDSNLSTKANQDTTYTKVEVDTSLASKANSADVYTQTEIDTSLATKANSIDTYTKVEVDTSLATKANQDTTYTKVEVDTSLATKANSIDTYTKVEVDTSLATKADTTSLSTRVKYDIFDEISITDTAVLEYEIKTGASSITTEINNDELRVYVDGLKFRQSQYTISYQTDTSNKVTFTDTNDLTIGNIVEIEILVLV